MTQTQEVETLRESLCFVLESPAVLEAHLERCLDALRHEGFYGEPLDYESIELWARNAEKGFEAGAYEFKEWADAIEAAYEREL